MKTSEELQKHVNEFKELMRSYKFDKTLEKEYKDWLMKEMNEFLQMLIAGKKYAEDVEKFIEDTINDEKEKKANVGKKKYAVMLLKLDREKKENTTTSFDIWLSDEELKSGNYEIPDNAKTKTNKGYY
jgi:hypothetical protein